MLVLTINQRDTLDAGDRVDAFLRSLGDAPGLAGAVALPFQRAVGDELIGAVTDPAAAVVWLWIAFSGFMVVRCAILAWRARGDTWMRTGA